MAPGIPVYSRLLRFWATVFRALGGFPYSWNSRDSETLFPGLKLRKGLQVWSLFINSLIWVFIILHTSTLVLNIWPDPLSTSLTNLAVRKVLQAVEILVILILQLHLWLKEGDLHCLFSHLDMCSSGPWMREWAIAHNKGYMFIILLHVIYIIFIVVGVLLSATISLALISEAIFYEAYTILVSVQILSLYMIGNFPYLLLTDIFETFNAKVKLGSSKYGSKRAEQANVLLQVEPWTKSSVVPVDYSASSEFQVALGSLAKRPREARESKTNVMRELCRKVDQVHEFQLLFNRYFGFPTLVITSISVFWVIHDVDSLIHNADFKISLKLLLYIIYCISVLVLLCCVNEASNRKVS